ncbi:MAG TPA: Bax inhibitor-1/YccA family protein [Acidimicrobiales bacterium]|nr:Bax inhibitor-1/YccA family protein [Acidimicrobiales bacterium]
MRTSNNPALTRSAAFNEQRLRTGDPLEEAFAGRSATSRETGRMTVDDVVNRTGLLLAIAFATGAVTWALDLGFLTFPAAIIGLVLSLVIIFKQVMKPGVIMAYAAVEGVFLGGISQFFDSRYPGIVIQAVVGTAAVTGGVLALYKSGRIKVTPQFTKMVVGATIGFFVLIMVNLVASVITGGQGLGLRQGTLGIVVGLFAIGLASMNLILDFDLVEKGARAGLPTRYGWFAAFGIMVTLVWLYIEILRLLAILRGND